MRHRGGVLALAGAAVLICAIASLGRPEAFAVTCLYLASTLAVGAAATLVTIRAVAALARGADHGGLFEAGLLIGLFAVAPTALSGAFLLLEAAVRRP